MRSFITRRVEHLPCPDESCLERARRSSGDPETHRRLLDDIEAFHVIGVQAPPAPLPYPERLRVAALNAERLIRPDAVRQLMDRVGADVLLLSEVDIGMARSGNVHTLRELTRSSGRGFLYGVEFVELDLGDREEMRRHAGERNRCALHGNAVVSALALEQPCVIPLEENGLWFKGFEGAQRRLGGRIAVAARLGDERRPVWIVSLHLESKTDPADRSLQVQALLRALDRLAPGSACIIGGDFNTKALPRGEDERARLLQAPESEEPLFTDFREAGFSWAGANRALPTQRDGPSKKHPQPFGRLDWFFVRGLAVTDPQVIPALDSKGQPISDHEMIAVDVVF